MIGANVVQKGTTNGTITDIDGKFTLEVPAKAVLTVSFIGYQSQDIALKRNEAQLTVTLKDDTEVDVYKRQAYGLDASQLNSSLAVWSMCVGS